MANVVIPAPLAVVPINNCACGASILDVLFTYPLIVTVTEFIVDPSGMSDHVPKPLYFIPPVAFAVDDVNVALVPVVLPVAFA